MLSISIIVYLPFSYILFDICKLYYPLVGTGPVPDGLAEAFLILQTNFYDLFEFKFTKDIIEMFFLWTTNLVQNSLQIFDCYYIYCG